MAFANVSSSLPELNPCLPLPENILRQASVNPDRTLGYILDDGPTETILNPVTWREVLIDVRQRARELVASLGRPARKLGEEGFVVGLLLRSSYEYFLTLTAVVMLRWTVCPYRYPAFLDHSSDIC